MILRRIERWLEVIVLTILLVIKADSQSNKIISSEILKETAILSQFEYHEEPFATIDHHRMCIAPEYVQEQREEITLVMILNYVFFEGFRRKPNLFHFAFDS